MRFDIRGENAGRRLRGTGANRAGLEDTDRRTSPRELTAHRTANDPAADHDDVVGTPHGFDDKRGHSTFHARRLHAARASVARASAHLLACVVGTMPRIRRVCPPGAAQHVLNRGNERGVDAGSMKVRRSRRHTVKSAGASRWPRSTGGTLNFFRATGPKKLSVPFSKLTAPLLRLRRGTRGRAAGVQVVPVQNRVEPQEERPLRLPPPERPNREHDDVSLADRRRRRPAHGSRAPDHRRVCPTAASRRDSTGTAAPHARATPRRRAPPNPPRPPPPPPPPAAATAPALTRRRGAERSRDRSHPDPTSTACSALRQPSA